MPTTDWYSYTVEGKLGCHFTGYVHVVSPTLHTVLFYNDGAPEVTASHNTETNKVEVSAWNPRTNTFKSVTIQKGSTK